jgi:hypothetical protein
MTRLLGTVVSLALLLTICPSPASAAFGLKETQVDFKDQHGAPALQAGSHPFAVEARFSMNTFIVPEGGTCAAVECGLPEGAVKDLIASLPPGFAGNPYAVPRCTAADFLRRVPDKGEPETVNRPACPLRTAIGIAAVEFSFSPVDATKSAFPHVPIYNLIPPPGVAARLGFVVLDVPVTADFGINPDPPYNIEARSANIAQAGHFYSAVLTTWGDPGDPVHDPYRGDCLVATPMPVEELQSWGDCPVGDGEREAFITLPRSCSGPLLSHFFARAWSTGATATATALTEPGVVGCPKLGFEPRISARPTTDHAESPSGLEFNLQIDDAGLTNPKEGAVADSDVKKAVVALPEGVTVNPSQAEGLAVCTEAELARESASSQFGAGCPAASKIGTVEVETPLLKGEILKGSLFVAEPYKNRFGSLLAIYQVIKSPERGIVLKLAGRVDPDPETGQLLTTFDDIPQQPFSDFRLRFREGGRSPLITPALCGTYETSALFTPWANPASPYEATASFEISHGVGGAPCPPAGTPPFSPGFSAGTTNNNAASYSPFAMRLTRRDGDQDLTRFDATLPPGVVAKLAGVSKCSDEAIAALKAKTGKQELASPSCPASSRIGRVIGGAGVGSQLTYVPGSVYLAGPLGKAPISVVGVVPAVAGPFDVGVISTRQALTLDPVTGQPRIDGSLSEPIPYILAGIPLKVRDIQVDVDRPQFTLNPTSCNEMAVQAQIWGGALDLFSSHDDAPVSRSDRFQAANCAALGFRPRLSFGLKGGTKRGANPAFKAILRPRSGDANVKRTVVRFSRSTFLDQSHIRTVCTRVQFAADSCPPGSIYGRVKAFTPLLDEPLRGPVYLRSSENLLPDIVFDLKGIVDIEAAARADSVNGKLRVTFPSIPDAPVSKVIVEMQGAKKGLLVNSRDICKLSPRALVELEGHNAKQRKQRPAMKAAGCKAKPRSRKNGR